MTDRPDIDWSFGHSLRIDAGSRLLDTAWQNEARLRPGRLQRRSRRVLQILLAGNRVGGNTVAVRRAALLEAGGWDENVACQDWGLWLRLAHHGKRHARRSHYLACRRIHGQQLTTVHQSDGTYDRDQQYFQKLYSHRWPATPRKSTRPLT